jgi:L,D-transpeptidase YcbB
MILKKPVDMFLLGALLTVLIFVGCSHHSSLVATVQDQHNEVTFTPPSPPFEIPGDTTDPIFNGLYARCAVIQFYQKRGTQAIWSTHLDKTSEADTLLGVIKNARYYGLLAANYHVAELTTPAMFPLERLRKEVLLTDAFLTLAQHLRYGRQPMASTKKDSIAVQVLLECIGKNDLKRQLEKQEPSFQGYINLKNALRIVLDTTNLPERELLLNGSIQDSIPAQSTVRRIEVNLERWRREEKVWPQRHIFINIPAFMLQVIDSGRVILESKVIVGTPEKQTPQLSSVIECFSIYPYWHVPRKISVEEYLPIIRKDSTFIRRNHFEVLNKQGKILNPDSVPWLKFNDRYFPVVLRQREGTENALGVIKFIFDNPYAVFLHDTNAKGLFRANVRAFSHGCIRMEKAEQLAHYLTTGSAEKKSKVVEKYLKQQQQHTINLSAPIPIYVRYFTEAADHGSLTIYKDLYNLDRGIGASLLFKLGTNDATPEPARLLSN